MDGGGMLLQSEIKDYLAGLKGKVLSLRGYL